MPRPAKKKTRVLAKAQREGELTAEVEHEYKSVKWIADMLPFLPEKYKKNAILWMKHLLEEHLSEIPKGIAVLGMTYIIKGLIDTSEELRTKMQKLTGLRWWQFISPMTMWWGMATQVEAFITAPEKQEGMFPDWADWLIAFTLAYIIIEHGGQIILGLGESVKGLTSMLGFLLG